MRKLTPLLLTFVLLMAACGSDDDTPINATDDADPTTTEVPSDDGTSSDEAPSGDDGAGDGAVIGEANLNGEVVDPQPHPIDEIVIAESYPEQLGITFTAGDPNCLAADATAEVVGDEVVVTLLVGITTDALTRSCLADQVQHTISIPLTEGLDGRTVVPAS